MITLKELYDMYHPYGVSDEQIIEAYFTKNHIEDKGIELMSNLTKERFKFYNDKIGYGKEYLLYCNVILDGNPKLNEKQRRTLHRHAISFTFYNDLDDKHISECAEIFETGNVQSCPLFFVLYLIKKGVRIQDNAIDMDTFSDTLESVVYRRDN